MAKTKKKTVTKTAVKEIKKNPGFLSQIKWGESYTSLFLGAVVVVISVILIFSFLKERNKMLQDTSSTATSVEQDALNSVKFKTYTVKPGDDLWHIAQSVYGSGYNWIDIANTNKLENPSVLFAGTKLMLPNVKQRTAEANQVTPTPTVKNVAGDTTSRIAGRSYKIQRGDDLWHIAVRAYGDGYKWVEIARINKLTDPNLIHADNTIMLPR